MADTQHTRQAKRTPVTLKIKFKSATLDQFIERYSVDVSHGGIFIRTKDPLPVGTQLRFEFQLKDASPLITGEGTVVWTREHDPSRTGVAPGMGVRFDRLADGSQEVLDKILQQKSTKGARPGTAGEFADNNTTKVAPGALMQGLASESGPKLGSMAPPRASFGDERTDATPLPQPMPFHSDADDFPDEAFEESTKVASLDELVARSARPDAGDVNEEDVVFRSPDKPQDQDAAEAAAALAMKDELAERRARKGADRSPDDEVGDDDQTAERAAASDETDQAAAEKTAAETAAKKADEPAAKKKADEPAAKKAGEPAAKKKTDEVAAKKKADEPAAKKKAAAATSTDDADRKVAAAAPSADEASSSGMTALLAVAVILVLIGGGAYWYFTQGQDTAVASGPDRPEVEQPGVAPGTVPPDEVERTGATDPVVPEPAPTFTAEIVTEPAGATVELVGGDQQGAAPFTFTLPEGEEHQIRVDADGFVEQTITVDAAAAGQPIEVALEAMPRVLSVSSVPDGAQVTVDGRRAGATPTEVELTGKLAGKDSYKVSLRKRGYKNLDLTVSGTEGFGEVGDKFVQVVSGELEERVVATKTRTTTTTKSSTGGTQSSKADTAKTGTGTKADTAKTDTSKTGTGSKADTAKTDTGSKADTAKSDTGKTDTKAGDTEAGDSNTGDSKTGDSKTGDTKTGDSKTGEPKADDPGDQPSGPTPDWMK